ncbi:CbrC family protein [Micromonospora yasonensis]|uniref:CbrC family protein n=1 Tax=Micromonospora yasonensis TaxID=1128667 RepID=UPI0038738DB5
MDDRHRLRDRRRGAHHLCLDPPSRPRLTAAGWHPQRRRRFCPAGSSQDRIVGPIYGSQVDVLCLHCIASGEAAWALTGAADLPRTCTDATDVPPGIPFAVARRSQRTPSFDSWPQPSWLYQCGCCAALALLRQRQLSCSRSVGQPARRMRERRRQPPPRSVPPEAPARIGRSSTSL